MFLPAVRRSIAPDVGLNLGDELMDRPLALQDDALALIIVSSIGNDCQSSDSLALPRPVDWRMGSAIAATETDDRSSDRIPRTADGAFLSGATHNRHFRTFRYSVIFRDCEIGAGAGCLIPRRAWPDRYSG
jgi:hypothetical protein